MVASAFKYRPVKTGFNSEGKFRLDENLMGTQQLISVSLLSEPLAR